jgi:hypothetical protein
MPKINEKKKKKTKKPVVKSTKALALIKKPKSLKIPPKNTSAYFECLNACCQQGIKPKNISQVSHECKSNALAIKAKLSSQKVKAVKKIQAGYKQLGKGLDEFIKSK